MPTLIVDSRDPVGLGRTIAMHHKGLIPNSLLPKDEDSLEIPKPYRHPLANLTIAAAAIFGGLGDSWPVTPPKEPLQSDIDVLQAEYELIQAKQSKLSRADRDRVVYRYEAWLRHQEREA